MSIRRCLICLALALAVAACSRPLAPGSLTPASGSPVTAAAATANAQVEAWAIATGTALHLTAAAPQTTSTPPPPTTHRAPTAVPSTAAPGISTPAAPPSATPRPRSTFAPAATATTVPTPLPASPSPSNADCYNQACIREIVSPDGQNRWPETCTNLGLDTICFITFSNGKVTERFGWPVVWSADGQYLAVPQGGNHDSFPGGYEIWNMSQGLPVGTFKYAMGEQRWSPTGHTISYLKFLPDGTKEFHLLDAGASADQVTRQCPTWATDALKNSDMFDWRSVCDNWTPPAGIPVVLDFTAQPAEANPGDTVTLAWTSTGATSAQVEQTSGMGNVIAPISVPVSGTLSITIPVQDRGWHGFSLVAKDSGGQGDTRLRMVQIRCPDAFFFTAAPPPASAGCPLKPAALIAAAEQSFEHGRMLWLAPVAAAYSVSGADEPASVYVLYDRGPADPWPTWQRFDDLWSTGEPEQDPTFEPPAGRLQPLRGFGMVWRSDAALRQKLGWATAPEQGFGGAYQVKWDVGARPSDLYLRGVDGSVLDLVQAGYWSVWHP